MNKKYWMKTTEDSQKQQDEQEILDEDDGRQPKGTEEFYGEN